MLSLSKRSEFYSVLRLFYEKHRLGSPTTYYFTVKIVSSLMDPNRVRCTLFLSARDQPFHKDPSLNSYEKNYKIMVTQSYHD
jgi:hypothetical protein